MELLKTSEERIDRLSITHLNVSISMVLTAVLLVLAKLTEFMKSQELSRTRLIMVLNKSNM